MAALAAIIVLCGLGEAALAQGWRTYDLLRGWRIDVPRSFEMRADVWRHDYDRDAQRKPEAELDWKSELIFVAQYLGPGGSPQLAFVGVRTRPEWDDIQAGLNRMTPEDRQRIYDEAAAGAEAVYRRTDSAIIERFPPLSLRHRRWEALHLMWRRSDPYRSTTLVQQLMIFNGRRSIGVTVSRDESRPDLKPVVERILASVRMVEE